MKPIVSKFPNNSNTEYRYQKHGIPGSLLIYLSFKSANYK